MKVLTYVEGILTVIRDDNFYKQEAQKPSFIKGQNFYYEPTLMKEDYKPLTELQINKTLEYIDSFDFYDATPSVVEYVHSIDAEGYYLGLVEKKADTLCVDSEPTVRSTMCDILYKYGVWGEYVVINNITKKFGQYKKCSSCKDYEFAPFNTMSKDIPVAIQYYIDGEWITKFEDFQKEKLHSLVVYSREVFSNNFPDVLFQEPASWKVQEEEARAWMTDNTFLAPLLDSLLLNRGFNETKVELASKIITKADAYKVFYGKLLGQLHAKQNEIESATTVEALKAIVW